MNILFTTTLIKGVNVLTSQIAQEANITSPLEVFDVALDSIRNDENLSFLPSQKKMVELMGEESLAEEIEWIRENIMVPLEEIIKEEAPENRYRLSPCAQMDIWDAAWSSSRAISYAAELRYTNAEKEEIFDLRAAVAGFVCTMLVYASAELEVETE